MTRHETSIAGLQPGTTYQFTIEGENKLGRYGAMHLGSFTTLPPDDIFPPANVANLRAEKSGDDVVLTWDNPGDPDLTKVRVMRSSQFYPSDIADGYVVYEGLQQEARDTGAVVVPGTRQYYTVFSYDALGIFPLEQ